MKLGFKFDLENGTIKPQHERNTTYIKDLRRFFAGLLFTLFSIFILALFRDNFFYLAPHVNFVWGNAVRLLWTLLFSILGLGIVYDFYRSIFYFYGV
ncbi:hypothetical protein AUJ93_03130 [bacterium CG2_30_33_46]|nr:MAG: hypothetical protein AUJ93_03130 [bacterium CG2_30_33_46]